MNKITWWFGKQQDSPEAPAAVPNPNPTAPTPEASQSSTKKQDCRRRRRKDLKHKIEIATALTPRRLPSTPRSFSCDASPYLQQRRTPETVLELKKSSTPLYYVQAKMTEAEVPCKDGQSVTSTMRKGMNRKWIPTADETSKKSKQ